MTDDLARLRKGMTVEQRAALEKAGSETAEIFGRWLFISAIAGTMIAINSIAAAFVWLWFVVPLGAPPITVAHATGIGCLISLLSNTPPPAPSDRVSDHAKNVIAKPFVALGIAWLAHLWMTTS